MTEFLCKEIDKPFTRFSIRYHLARRSLQIYQHQVDSGFVYEFDLVPFKIYEKINHRNIFQIFRDEIYGHYQLSKKPATELYEPT